MPSLDAPDRLLCLAQAAAWHLLAEVPPKANLPVRAVAHLADAVVGIEVRNTGQAASLAWPAEADRPDKADTSAALAALLRVVLTGDEREVLAQIAAGPPSALPAVIVRVEERTGRHWSESTLKYILARLVTVGLAENPKKSGYRITSAGRQVLGLLARSRRDEP